LSKSCHSLPSHVGSRGKCDGTNKTQPIGCVHASNLQDSPTFTVQAWTVQCRLALESWIITAQRLFIGQLNGHGPFIHDQETASFSSTNNRSNVRLFVRDVAVGRVMMRRVSSWVGHWCLEEQTDDRWSSICLFLESEE